MFTTPQHGAHHPGQEKKERTRKEIKFTSPTNRLHTNRHTGMDHHLLLGDDPHGVDDAGDPAETGEHDGDQELNLRVQKPETTQYVRNLDIVATDGSANCRE
jgi:hypothetical protein